MTTYYCECEAPEHDEMHGCLNHAYHQGRYDGEWLAVCLTCWDEDHMGETDASRGFHDQ